MKKVLLGLGVAACVVGFGGSAFAAGTGGIAGSVAFQIDAATAAVSSASAAVAVGKTTAYAGAATDLPGGTTEAFATGTGGAITLLPAGSIYIDSIAEETPAGLLVAQANSIDITTAVLNVDATTGIINVTP